jgi:hypothetical protein
MREKPINAENFHSVYSLGIGGFFGFSHLFLLEILIFKGRTARRHYKLFGVKGLRFSPKQINVLH